jgi:hypothetical protein
MMKDAKGGMGRSLNIEMARSLAQMVACHLYHEYAL